MQAAAEEEEDEEVVYDPQLSSNNQGFQAPGRRAKVKPGPSLKQGMTRRGKSRLLTLQATGTEEDDDDEEDVEDCDVSSNVEEENQAFVPMSLRSLPPDNSEVLETVEEVSLDIITVIQCFFIVFKAWGQKHTYIMYIQVLRMQDICDVNA